MTDVQTVVGRLLGDGMTEAQIVALLEGLAEAVEDGTRQWELTLHDLSAYTAFALGGFTGQVVRDAEAQGYERAGKALQAYRVLLANAEPILRRAAEDTDYAAAFFPGWSARLRLVLETGEYPGLTTRLLEGDDSEPYRCRGCGKTSRIAAHEPGCTVAAAFDAEHADGRP